MRLRFVRTLLNASFVGCVLLPSLTGATTRQQQDTAEQVVERVRKAIQNDEWGCAQSGIRHALALKPESAEANLLAAQVYLHEGARSKAIEALEKAVKSQPIFPEAHFLLAECLLDERRLDNAREEVNIAIAQGTPLPSCYRLLAKIHLAKDEFDAAILSLRTAIQWSQSDTDDATDLRVQIEQLLEFVEKLKVF